MFIKRWEWKRDEDFLNLLFSKGTQMTRYNEKENKGKNEKVKSVLSWEAFLIDRRVSCL